MTVTNISPRDGRVVRPNAAPFTASRVPFRLPPAIGHDEIDAAIGAYLRLVGQLNDARLAVRAIEDRRKEAEQADRQAFADALRAGAKDPGPKHLRKHEEEALDARRRREALEQACGDAGVELVALVEAHRAEVVELTATNERAAAERVHKAVAELLDAGAAWLGALDKARFARGFPRTEWRPRRAMTVELGDRKFTLEQLGAAIIDAFDPKPPDLSVAANAVEGGNYRAELTGAA
jgi:hypothetical protein